MPASSASRPPSRTMSRRLSLVETAELRRLISEGVPLSVLSRAFGVSYPTVWKLAHSEEGTRRVEKAFTPASGSPLSLRASRALHQAAEKLSNLGWSPSPVALPPSEIEALISQDLERRERELEGAASPLSLENLSPIENNP